MESLSHSRKNYGDNGGSGGYGPARHKTVYDDVFGGPPKFGAPTLPPRLEDYTEIFQGFHASRGSSIPVLDLPPVTDDDDDLWFDVQASKFDYSEVFGGFNGLDFAVSYEKLFKKSNTLEDDSSEEAWTPAHSESLSDESDPYASLDTNQRLSNADPDQSFGMATFKLSHNTGSLNAEKDVSDGMTKNHSRFHDVPVSSVFDNQILPPRKMEKTKVSSQANNDHYGSNNSDFGKQLKKSQEGARERKQLKKSLSQPLDGTGRFGSDLNHLAGHHKPDSMGSGPVFSVSGISLKTQPSQLPPPSRPPPALASKKEEAAGVGTKLKTSKSYCFERMAGDSSPPYFDVEIDASSSAAASAAAMKDAVEQAQAKLRSAKELMEKKKDVLQSRTKLRMENDVEDKEGRVIKTNGRSSGFEGEGMKQLHERDGSKIKHKAREERQKTETINTVTASIEGEKNINEVRNSIARKVMKEPKSSQGSDEIRGTVASREAPTLNEPVAGKRIKDMEILEPNAKSRELRKNNKSVYRSFDQQEDDTIAHTKEGCQLKENMDMQEILKMSHWEEEHLKKANVALKACEWSEREKIISQQHDEFKILNEADENELYENLIEIQLKDNETETGEKLVGVNGKVDTENQLNTRWKGYQMASVQASNEEGYDSGHQEDAEQEHERRLKKTLRKDAKEKQPGAPEVQVINSEEKEDHGRGVVELVRQEEDEKRSLKTFVQEENDNTSEMVLEQVDNKSEQVLEDNKKVPEKELRQEKYEKKAEEPFEQEENTKKQGNACDTEESEKSLNHAREKEEIGKRYKLDCHSEENRKLQEDQESEESEKGEEAVLGNSGIENEQEAAKLEEDDRRLNMKKENHSRAVDEKSEASNGAYKVDDNEVLQANGDIPRYMPIGKVETVPETPLCQKDGNPRSHWDNRELGAVKQIYDLGKEWFCSTDLNQSDFQHEKDENDLGKEWFCSTDLNQSDFQHEKDEVRMDDTRSSDHLHESAGKPEGLNIIEQTQVESDKTVFKRTTGLENANNFTHNVEGERMNIKGLQSGLVPEESKNSSTSPQLAEEWVEVAGNPLPNLVPPVRNVDNPGREVISKSMERKDECRYKTLSEEREKEEKLQRERELENYRLRKIEEERERERERELENDRLRKLDEEREKKRIEEERERKRIEEERERKRERELENDRLRKIEEERERQRERELENERLRKIEEERERQQERELENERLRKIEEERERRRERELEDDRLRKIEEERERQREREKDRMAVDRATLEARERPIAEARERAERAAVERATAEFRQRALAEARERLEKACAEARERSLSEKTSESRFRAERPAVEKTPVEASERAERSLADKYSASRSSGTRQSYLSTELPDSQFQKVGSYSGLRYSHTAAQNGEGESPQRCKARLERHQRTADRAAKALAEKNMRDLIAQKEQAERNRLAETLDAEVKRWSTGKQGNLRALLSTLQYILGPDSGWHPVPLTEVITTAAVKKAYRKATLCVHPDKLQQRGANIQQKYICEKVFDLLKEAWNRFNSEER